MFGSMSKAVESGALREFSNILGSMRSTNPFKDISQSFIDAFFQMLWAEIDWKHFITICEDLLEVCADYIPAIANGINTAFDYWEWLKKWGAGVDKGMYDVMSATILTGNKIDKGFFEVVKFLTLLDADMNKVTEVLRTISLVGGSTGGGNGGGGGGGGGGGWNAWEGILTQGRSRKSKKKKILGIW